MSGTVSLRRVRYRMLEDAARAGGWVIGLLQLALASLKGHCSRLISRPSLVKRVWETGLNFMSKSSIDHPQIARRAALTNLLVMHVTDVAELITAKASAEIAFDRSGAGG